MVKRKVNNYIFDGFVSFEIFFIDENQSIPSADNENKGSFNIDTPSIPVHNGTKFSSRFSPNS
jgi:hypothetical protein